MTPPTWLGPLVATMTAQTASSFLSRVIPTIAPTLISEVGFTPAFVGYLVAIGSVGSMIFLLAGFPLIRQAGPVRALQIGMVLGILGTALLAVPLWSAAILASLLIGLGYGPSTPAGSEILQRHAPARRRNLIFSVKQASVPLGGMAAGFTLPALALAGDWRITLLFAAVVVLLATIAIEPLRQGLDQSQRADGTPLSLRSLVSDLDLRGTFGVLLKSPELVRFTVSGACFAFGQGCWFAYLVTYLVVGLDLGLIAAGSAFSIMQAMGVLGRILFGWMSDRTGAAIATLRLVAIASAATSAAIAWIPGDAGYVALLATSAIAGLTVSSWNGIQLAEIARASPPGTVSQTTSAATLFIFVGYAIGPIAFAVVLALADSYRLAFLLVAAVSLLPLLTLSPSRSRSG